MIVQCLGPIGNRCFGAKFRPSRATGTSTSSVESPNGISQYCSAKRRFATQYRSAIEMIFSMLFLVVTVKLCRIFENRP